MNKNNQPQPRWNALLNDRVIPMPRPTIPVSLLRTQGAITDGDAIVWDYGSPNDLVLDDNANLRLAEGNVFYTRPRCDLPSRANVTDISPKRALFVDDRFELTTLAVQPVEAVLELFGLSPGTELVRDLESPDDEHLAPGSQVRFDEGPVFLSRARQDAFIKVAVVTTSGTFPPEGFVRVPRNQPIKVVLAEAVRALQLTDVSNWFTRGDGRELNPELSYADNLLQGCVEIDYGPRAGGGGGQ